jgi:hypothetical protein
MGTQNLAYYFTKHHPGSHHYATRPIFLTPGSDPEYTKIFLTSPAKDSDVKPKSIAEIKNLLLRNYSLWNNLDLQHDMCSPKCLSNLQEGCFRPNKVGDWILARTTN